MTWITFLALSYHLAFAGELHVHVCVSHWWVLPSLIVQGFRGIMLAHLHFQFFNVNLANLLASKMAFCDSHVYQYAQMATIIISNLASARLDSRKIPGTKFLPRVKTPYLSICCFNCLQYSVPRHLPRSVQVQGTSTVHSLSATFCPYLFW